jgi:hypothetical protein
MALLRPRASFLPLVVATIIGITPYSAAAQQAGPFFINGDPTDGSGAQPQPVGVPDDNGSTKELGPINSNTTKVGVIHTAATPMLGLTNPNGQVDLNTVYTQTAKDTSTGHLWYYFAWTRDSNSGSGFIAVEFQQADLSAACKTAYTNAACNPWSARQANDFLLLWDQSGGSTDILKRLFTKPVANGPLVLGASSALGSAVAKFSADGFSGELAIDLTEDVFPQDGTCVNFANIIPGTVTGNSDSADYKDTVLSAFPDVKNCGGVTITKKTSPAGLSGTFVYTLSDSGPIFPTNSSGVVQKDSDCTNATGTDTQCVATLTSDGDSDTIDGLLGGTAYSLTENPGSGFTLTSISCKLGTTTYTGAAFPVEPGQTTACLITNTVVKATPAQNTVQAGWATIADQINLSDIKAHASNTGVSVTFRLYSDSACTTQVGSDMTRALTYTAADANGKRTATANTTSTPVSINQGTVYYWKVTYPGDDLNNGFTTSCGQETATVSFTFVQ